MPMGIPAHLAQGVTSRALSVAGHAIAAVLLIGDAIIAVTVQLATPDLLLWPLAIVFAFMIALLAVVDRSPQPVFIAAYLVVGAGSVLWLTLVSAPQLSTPVANDSYPVVLAMMAMVLVVPGPSLLASFWWAIAGYVIAEATVLATFTVLGARWAPSVWGLAAVLIVCGLTAILMLDARTARRTQVVLNRAVQDELIADVRRGFEQRGVALLHDSVLSTLSALAVGERALDDTERTRVLAEIEQLAGQGWFDAPTDQGEGSHAARLARLAASIHDAAEPELIVSVNGRAPLGDLSTDSFDELVRATVQCVENARRHSGARGVEVVLGAEGGGVSVLVVDEGRGFDPDRLDEQRLGIRHSLMARLESVGGSAMVWSSPGNGTSVLLRVPVDVSTVLTEEVARDATS